MSQFIFGEILLSPSRHKFTALDSQLSTYPFSFRFDLSEHDYFCKVSKENDGNIPFVITDSFIDNTAELILRSDFVSYPEKKLPKCYDQLLSKPLSVRVFLLVSALTDALSILDARECILVLSDGTGIPEEKHNCNLSDLCAKIIKAIQYDQCFITGCYRVYK